MEELRLVIPDESYEEEIVSYRQAMLDAGSSMDGCGKLRSQPNPADWLDFNRKFMNQETIPVPGWNVCTQFVAVRQSDRRIVGMIQVRENLNEYCRNYAGHIGYSVRPDERRKGYATRMLHDVLPFCRERGLDRVMISCLKDNEASRRTILSNGGVYDSTVRLPEKDEDLERYWITLK